MPAAENFYVVLKAKGSFGPLDFSIAPFWRSVCGGTLAVTMEKKKMKKWGIGEELLQQFYYVRRIHLFLLSFPVLILVIFPSSN